MQMGRWYRIALRFGGEHEKRAGIAQCTCYACCGKQGSGWSNQHRGGVVNVRMQFVQLQVSSDTPDSKAGKLGPTLVRNTTLPLDASLPHHLATDIHITTIAYHIYLEIY